MNKKSLFELWILDSAIRGKDPILRFFEHAYIWLFGPLYAIGIFSILVDENYFHIVALLFKGIWWFWIKTAWFLITHFEVVVWFCRNLIAPGCCGTEPTF